MSRDECHSEGRLDKSGQWEMDMYIRAIWISIFLLLMVLLAGCSEDERPQVPAKRNSVKRPIDRPETKKDEVLPTPKEIKPETVLKEEEETEITPSETIQPVKEDEIKKEEDKGYYIINKGDSLTKIAGKGDVYGDPLKWPIIYRLNMVILGGIGIDKDAPYRDLEEGIRLRIIRPDDASEILKTMPKKLWIINTLSAQKRERIVPNTIRLIKNGYHAYLTRTRVKGEDWTRVRVGFFRNRKEAEKEGKKIKELMNLNEVWITKVDEKEFEEFGGY